MGDLTEVDLYVAAIHEIDTTELVKGGPGGPANTQAQELANRTHWLKARAGALVNAAGIPFMTIDEPSATIQNQTVIKGGTGSSWAVHGDAAIALVAGPNVAPDAVLQSYFVHVTASAAGSILQLQTPGAVGFEYSKTIFNDTANAISIQTQYSAPVTLEAHSVGTFYFVALVALTTDLIVRGPLDLSPVLTNTGGVPTWLASSMQATADARMRVYSNIASVTTADATVTTVYSWAITDECVTVVTVEASAVKTDGSKTASYLRRCRIKRDGGVVTLGLVLDMFTDQEAQFDCNVTIDASGSTGRVRVTGIAATNIQWGAVVTRTELTHA